MTTQGAPPRRREAGPDAPRRAAELWRAVGLGLSVVWTVVLVLVVLFWARVAFFPRAGDDLPGSLQLLLAPVSLAAAVLAVWTLVGAWRIVRRRTSGWDAISVDGAFAVAVALLLTAPSRILDDAPTPSGGSMLALAALGLGSVVAARQARRAFDRAAVGLEPSDDSRYGDDEEDFG